MIVLHCWQGIKHYVVEDQELKYSNLTYVYNLITALAMPSH